MATQNETNQSNEKAKSGGWVKNFIFKHKFVLFLILVIIVVFAWSLIRMNSLERSYERQITELVSDYETRVDSLTVANMRLTTRVFTWAIRSEMLRDNTEQVNHFFNDFIRIPAITKVQLIEPETFEIILSTDRKDRGNIVEDINLYDKNELVVEARVDDVLYINPVMGLDTKLGILAITMKME